MVERRTVEAVEPSPDDETWDPSEPFGAAAEFPITETLDLHGLPPKMVPEVVASYLAEARRLGYRDVRIVHGKGIGVQRERVRAMLGRTDFVEHFADAPAERGGWGATVVRLAPVDGDIRPAPYR